jgi:phage-related minor tail protein
MFLDMAAQIIAKQMTMIILQTILKALGAISGGTQSAGSAAGAKAFGGSGPKFNPGAFSMPKLAANGATFANGIAQFASGGIVSSPTLFKFADGGTTRTGLMGEAGPEAIMPLKRGPDGSLGVQANGLREAMGRPPGATSKAPVLNMKFETTSINGVEYVSRDQLESAMAVTRRQAANDGASRGMNMTLDKIQNSPSTRARVGIR